AVYTVFAQHRTSGGRKPGAQINQQLDNMSSFSANLYLFAHSHKASVYSANHFHVPPRGSLELVRDRRVLITANAWVADVVSGADSYADDKGLPAASDLVYFAEARYISTTSGRAQVTTTPR